MLKITTSSDVNLLCFFVFLQKTKENILVDCEILAIELIFRKA